VSDVPPWSPAKYPVQVPRPSTPSKYPVQVPRPSAPVQVSQTKHPRPNISVHMPTPGMPSVCRATCSFTRFTPELSQRGVCDPPWGAIVVGERMRAWRAWREVAP
jgi:hypothetical protein